jgi:pimeloyl-ACP methyl ester carboxylesterase
VDDLVNLLDHLQIERAPVVGYSLGAAITLKLLTAHPERVRSAVLAAGGWRQPGESPPPWRAAWLHGLERAGAEGTSVIEVLRQPDWPELAPEVEAAVNRNDPRALAAVLRGDVGLAVTEAELRANAVPTIAVVGSDDLMARDAVERMAGVMANLEVTLIPDANHLTALTHPLLLQTMLGFLRSH